MNKVEAEIGLAERTSVESRYDEEIERDPARTIEAWRRLQASMEARHILFRGAPLPTSLKPHMVPLSQFAGWIERMESAMTGVEALSRLLLSKEAVTGLLGLSKEAWDLISIDPGYEDVAVVARPDMVWHGHELAMLELNTDSPAMMTFADLIQEVQRELYPFAGLMERHTFRFDRRTGPLLDALLACYRGYGGKKASPALAIVDWRDVKTIHEQQATARDFSAAGCDAFCIDPRDLRIERNRLVGGGREIDIVYRRVLFPEFLERPDDVAVLLRAYRDGIVCMVNPLRSFVVGTKLLLAVVDEIAGADPRDVAAIKAVLPETKRVDAAARAELVHQREEWVLKRAISHGGTGVLLGPFVEQSAWEQALELSKSEIWIAQRTQPVPTYQLPIVGTAQLTRCYANWNPFFFGGQYGGSITRASKAFCVSISSECGALLPTIGVEEATHQRGAAKLAST